MEQNITSLNQVRIHSETIHQKKSKCSKCPMLICSSLPYSESENKLPNCKRKKRDVFKRQIAILSEIQSSVKWRSHSRLKNKWEAEIQIAIKDKKNCSSVLFQTLDTLCFKVDQRMAKVDFWNTSARKRENGIVTVPQEQGLKTAGIVSNA